MLVLLPNEYIRFEQWCSEIIVFFDRVFIMLHNTRPYDLCAETLLFSSGREGGLGCDHIFFLETSHA